LEASFHTVCYGFDRIRFITPVRSGSRVRARFTASGLEEKRPGQFQQSMDVMLEVEGSEKPTVSAIWISMFFQ
jgi:acyl dehydratase